MRRSNDPEIAEDLPHPEPHDWPYVATAADAEPDPAPRGMIDSLLMQRLELVALGFVVVMTVVQALRPDPAADISAEPATTTLSGSSVSER
jgi:hypothetical protein